MEQAVGSAAAGFARPTKRTLAVEVPVGGWGVGHRAKSPSFRRMPDEIVAAAKEEYVRRQLPFARFSVDVDEIADASR